jgi:hypothetical protein
MGRSTEEHEDYYETYNERPYPMQSVGNNDKPQFHDAWNSASESAPRSSTRRQSDELCILPETYLEDDGSSAEHAERTTPVRKETEYPVQRA